MANVIVHVAGRGAPAGPAHARRVGREHGLELDDLCPERVVVVLAVDAEGVEPVGVLGHLRVVPGRVLLRDRLDRAAQVARNEGDLEAELGDGELELLDALLRRLQRDRRDGGQAVRVRAEHVRVVLVDRSHKGAPQVRVAHVGGEGRHVREERREVAPRLRETLVQEARQRDGREIEGVLGGEGPPRRPRRPARGALLGRQVVPFVAQVSETAIDRGPKAVDCARAAVLRDVVLEGGRKLDRVEVGVDHRVVEARADGRGLRRLLGLEVDGAHRVTLLVQCNGLLRSTVGCEGLETCLRRTFRAYTTSRRPRRSTP